MAAQEGVSFIDVKEPARGSLGNPDPLVLHEVIQALKPFPSVMVSSAGGELHSFSPSLISDGPFALSYFKLGLSNMGRDRQWVRHWLTAREQIDQLSSPEGLRPGWIAVAYVDEDRAESPAVDDIISAAIDHQCAGVLFDTFEKSGRRLTEQVPLHRLGQWLDRLHQHRLPGVVAGQLRLEDIPPLRAIGADIIGFRSAACRNQNRVSGLASDLIRQLLDV